MEKLITYIGLDVRKETMALAEAGKRGEMLNFPGDNPVQFLRGAR